VSDIKQHSKALL